MYSVVLATMLVAGSTTPAWHHHGHCGGIRASCHACYSGYGCYNAFSGHRHHQGHHSCVSYGCSCYSSCFGCSGCFGCSSCFGGYSGYACSCSCSGIVSYGCTGCCGGVVVAPSTPQVVPVPASNPEVEALRKEIRELREQLKKSEPIPDPKGKQASTATARVTVSLPADARLWVENVECPLTSNVRSFNTPALNANQRYVYNLTMQVVRNGEPQRESQRVIVIPGQEVNVNFNAVTTAAR